MKEQIASASRVIDASPDQVYQMIADYRNKHPLMVPKQYFLHLHVEEGGYGAGTVISFSMRILGRTQNFRALITEPEPGRLLVETDIQSQTPTSFRVAPLAREDQCRVTISTDLKGRNWLEGMLAKPMLQKIYQEELALLARLAGSPTSPS